jgi:type II secretory pathway component GspD/PulD (secretin)
VEDETSVSISLFDARRFSKATYYHFAKDQNFSDLIHDFFSMQDMTFVISNQINYTVNGKFSKINRAALWNFIATAEVLV